MMVILPIKSGSRWVPMAAADYATALQAAQLVAGCRLKNLANIIEPLITDHALGNLDEPATRLRIKAALTSNGRLPYFEIKGVRQELNTEWLDLVVRTNTRFVCGYRNFAKSVDPETLDAYPARELVHVRGESEPYDWKARWTAAGGKIFGDRMIALKSDAVWLKISDFGHPHPPFAFGSGMDMVDVSRVEAVELGLTNWRTEIEVPPCPICDAEPNSGNGNGEPALC